MVGLPSGKSSNEDTKNSGVRIMKRCNQQRDRAKTSLGNIISPSYMLRIKRLQPRPS